MPGAGEATTGAATAHAQALPALDLAARRDAVERLERVRTDLHRRTFRLTVPRGSSHLPDHYEILFHANYIATLRTIIDQFPNTPQAMIARNRLALAFVDLDRWNDAVSVLEEMAAKNEYPNETYFRLAEIYERRLKNYDKAMENYAKVPASSQRYNDAQRKLKERKPARGI